MAYLLSALLCACLFIYLSTSPSFCIPSALVGQHAAFSYVFKRILAEALVFDKGLSFIHKLLYVACPLVFIRVLKATKLY